MGSNAKGGPVGGHVAPGFEKVRDVFARHIETDTLGAACTIYHRGECVVDLYGGWKDKTRTRPWEHDTIVLVYSVSKGLSGAACAVAASKGLFSYDENVGDVWPEFDVYGKGQLTVGQVLSEQSGVAALDLKLNNARMADSEFCALAVEQQKPNWKPGQYSGNHPYSLSWLACELISRRDPYERHLERFFAEEVAAPVGADAFLGLPKDFDRDRIARIDGFGMFDLVFRHTNMSWALVASMFWPWSLSFRALNNPLFLKGPAELDEEQWWRIEQGAAGGMASAPALAKIYNVFATGGETYGITQEVADQLARGADLPPGGLWDPVLHTDLHYSYGFEKPSGGWEFARTPSAFGTFAIGGSMAFADPDDEVAYAWITNQLGTWLRDDPREKDVREAFYQCLVENARCQ